ncbi:alpha-2-macroglobulin-like [Heptranchias perlo]|uniref:alpha-2-macroglobulin-like n=1 Tax=Heptranchias perlo TaxID=212740 RepID=UPI00355A3283
MRTRDLLVCLLLGAVRACPHFVILIPTELRTDSPEKVCVLLLSRNDPTSLKLTIDYVESNITIFEKELVGDSQRCLNFTVKDEDVKFQYSALLKVTVTCPGENVFVNKTKKVILKRYNSLTFVQTDKPIYKPGQTVKFRIVTLNENFIHIQEKYPVVVMWDPRRNRIGQWKNVEARQGIASLTFDIVAEPLMGSYRIQVEKAHGNVEHSFQVEEYVLPKFQLQLQFPKSITILDPTIHFKVCGRYTYGKPTIGQIKGTVCLIYSYYPEQSNNCQQVFGETDSDGCLSRDLSTAIFHLKRRRYKRDILARFVLKEDGTGIEMEQSATCTVTAEVVQINFKEAETYFKKGLPHTGQLRIQYSTGQAVPNATLYIFSSLSPGAQKVITDQNGIWNFSLDTSSWSLERVSITAIYRISQTDHYLVSAWQRIKPFYSRSNSYFQIRRHQQQLSCDTELQVTVDYTVNRPPVLEEHGIVVSYLVMARGLIVSFEQKTISVEGSQGEFHLTLQVNADIAPIARLLVLTVLSDGEIIADSMRYGIPECFRNKVSLQFSVSEDLPTSHISLDLQASPGSLCGVRVVDQSVLLLKPEKELSRKSVYSLLPVQDLSGYPYPIWEDPGEFCDREGSGLRSPHEPDSIEDVATLLQDMGLKIVTDTHYHVPLDCSNGLETMFRSEVAYGAPFQPTGPAVKTRAYFPETWIWDLIPVGSSGSASLPLTVPDSITEWKGSMFCTGEVGFGLSDTVSLNAFKPFFLELALPYSVIRTEGFKLKAKVFNYMTQCIMVQLTLLQAQGFEVMSNLNTGHQTCVCSKESVTLSWNLTATGLGSQNVTVRAESIESDSLCGNELVTVPVKGAVDIIQKSLIIQPEGTETELTLSSFLCPAGKTITEKIHLQVPENVVEGSSRADITVLGDIMGSAMENLDGLLRLPTGCGEQNMVKFAPNIYVQRYLNQTNQLTEEIQAKAISFLQTGYQRQLTFKHNDGSFSAFGESDPEGNTWLTAFVLKSFLQARTFIFIDDSVLRQSTRFFLKYRLESGCFASVGHLWNNAMQGGVDDHISLSAYVTSTLLELNKTDRLMAEEVYREWRHQPTSRYQEEPASQFGEEANITLPWTIISSNERVTFETGVTDGALGCLRRALDKVNSTYTLALLAYTFTLAGDQATREQLLLRLEGLAIKQGGLTHWQRADKAEEEEWGFWWRAPSAEVEMTAYVLLALLSKPQVTISDLSQATPIVSWLVKQRNSQGGFASTQDTVVALQALSLYAQLTHVSEPHNSVTISTEAGIHSEFHVDASNQLLLQRQKLEEIPGDYSVQVKGKSCLLLQATLRYNTPPAMKDPAFSVTVEMVTVNSIFENTSEISKPRIDINVTFTGDRPVSNMVIVDVKMLSGYSADESSDLLPRENANVSKLEIRDDHVIIYIESMKSHRLLQLSFHAIHNFEVENLQPAYVKVYDYYETGDSAIAEYHRPIRTDSVTVNTVTRPENFNELSL